VKFEASRPQFYLQRHWFTSSLLPQLRDELSKVLAPTRRTSFHRPPTHAVSNSRMGKAITCLLRHWRPFTLFLRQAGAPLDINLCRKSIQAGRSAPEERFVLPHSKRSTGRDLFMTLIHTCQLCGSNSFNYLTELQRHAQKLAACRRNGCRGAILKPLAEVTL
jgi:hypothetical protein